jgi:predicted metal-dependent phosphoesterase TrpH
MIARLADAGIALDEEEILRPALDDPRKAAGRPWVARALVTAGHVPSVADAFDRWLGRGKPGFVPRTGSSPAEVIARIHDAGGLASLAHPGLLRHDEWLGDLVAAGLDALEAYHTEHDGPTTAHYLALAAEMGIAVSGGSDFHGDNTHGARDPGAASLPDEAYQRLLKLR